MKMGELITAAESCTHFHAICVWKRQLSSLSPSLPHRSTVCMCGCRCASDGSFAACLMARAQYSYCNMNTCLCACARLTLRRLDVSGRCIARFAIKYGMKASKKWCPGALLSTHISPYKITCIAGAVGRCETIVIDVNRTDLY